MFRVKFWERLAALGGVMALAAGPAQAYLFWTPPAISGAPATGDQPGIASKLDGATAAEQQANLIWAMRAGLNVAALQCQFQPALQTVANYNNMLRQHAAELQKSYTTLTAYFKRTAPKTWQTALDQYTTRTYNSFSTLNAQIIFCETAASIGRDTLMRPRGQLGAIATSRMREFRNSLTPANDAAFAATARYDAPPEVDVQPECFDKKGRPAKC
jgi:hypothetical protein